MTLIDEDYVGGEQLTVERTVENVPAALVTARFAVKNDPDDADGDAIVMKTITASPSADGQITDTGADGTGFVRFVLQPADTQALEGPRFRHFEIKCYPTGVGPGVVDSGQIRLRKGVIDATV